MPSLAIISFLRTQLPGISHTVVTQCQSAFIYGQGIPDLIAGETMHSYLHLMVGKHKSKDGEGGKGKKKEIVKASFRLRNFLEQHLLFLTTIAAINHVKTVSGNGSSLTLPSKQEV